LIKYFLLLAIIFNLFVYAKDEIRFGVFAYLGKEQTYEKYKHLEKYLNSVLKQKVVIEILSIEEMEEKIFNKQLDIATTNPTHFLVVRQKFALSGAIATLVAQNESEVLSSHLGGVIIAKANGKINTVHDIKGKTIATPSVKHMGGFRSQAYELSKYGIDVINNKKILEINTSHQDVIKAVLEDKAEVGFVRDGIVELMIANQTLRMDDIIILNKQSNKKHPYIVSTELYPEWPVFALPYTDEGIVKNIISALYSIEPNMPFSKLSGIGGYTLPADYLKVEELARTLKLPPFDKIYEIGYKEIWQKYKFDIIVTFLALFIILAYYIKDFRRKDFLNSLLINIGDGVYGVDKNGNCIWINKSALDMVGFSKKEVLYKNQHLLFHHHKTTGELYQECQCPIHLTIKDKKTRECDEHFIAKNGKFFPVHLSVSPHGKKGGAIVIFRDISKQKEQEQQIIKHKDKLELIMKTAHIGLWEFDVSEKNLFLDKNIYFILEYPDNISLDYDEMITIIHPDDRQKFDNILNYDFAFYDEFKIEIRIQRKDGSYAWIEVCGKATKKDNDFASNILLGTFNDITHIKEYEEILEDEVKIKTKELEDINQNLEFKVNEELEKNRQKDILLQQQSRLVALGEMIGNIAHQWRQPLSVITASVSGLQLKHELGFLSSCDIAEINDNVMNNARFLTNTIENFSKFFKQDVSKKSFFVVDVLNDTISIIQASYNNNFIQIEKHFDKSLDYYGSENLLSQVVLNILSNSKDAFISQTQDDNKNKKVIISLFKDDKNIKITIKDNAGGIPENIKEKIFDPYFTTKHQSQGTGLGLFMSAQIIKTNFDGTISVDNTTDENGFGACFEISFPLNNNEDAKRLANE
jgi:PAS domain S-box-containing protein